MQKIIFFSSFCDESHLVFEASLVQIYMSIYSDKEYFFVSSEHHLNLIKEKIPNLHRLNYVPIRTRNRKRLLLLGFLKIFNIGKGAQVIHLYNYFPLSIGTFLFLTGKMDILFMHQYRKDARNKSRAIFNFCALHIFFTFKKRTKIVVLGKWIFDNIKKDRFFWRKDRFFWMDHPYIVDEPKINKSIKGDYSITFGLFITKDISYKNIEIGDINKIKLIIEKNGGKLLEMNGGFVPEDEYKNLFQSIDYVFLLNKDPAYRYRASCMFIEAIFYKKPILCYNGDMSNHYFKTHGDIGYKYEDVESMAEGIKEILGSDNGKRYKKQILNLIEAKKNYTHIKKYKGILEKLK